MWTGLSGFQNCLDAREKVVPTVDGSAMICEKLQPEIRTEIRIVRGEVGVVDLSSRNHRMM